MSVISLTLTESAESIIAGMPKTVALSTNIPSVIFYTLDGSTPTLFSTSYTTPIFLPTDLLSVTLSAFASDGTNTSPIIVEVYKTNILQNARFSHVATDTPTGTEVDSLYPFGTHPTDPNVHYLNPGDAGTTVNNPDLPQIPNGFDENGNPNSFSNLPYDTINYKIVYTDRNAIGEYGLGIGTLPPKSEIKRPSPVPETTDQYSKMFDPRALVTFQDVSMENPNDPPNINRQYYTSTATDYKNPTDFYNTGFESNGANGSFIRSTYNPRDNTMTHYYRDSRSNKWIISKAPYMPHGTYDGNLGNVVVSSRPGARFVFRWASNRRRALF